MNLANMLKGNLKTQYQMFRATSQKDFELLLKST